MPTDINTEMTSPGAEYATNEMPPRSHPDPGHALPAPPRTSLGLWIGLGVLALLVAGAILYGLLARSAASHRLQQAARGDALLPVHVVHPSVAGVASTLALPGNTQAFNDTPIYARTNGYLKRWFVDIGQHVRKGELMATIETPEVDQQLLVARANLKSAQADLALANTTSQRYQNLLKQDSVSRQETDVAISNAAAKDAGVEAAEANVRRLQQLQSFEQIYAPFSGVVTTRNTDIGALIDAGSGSSQPRDLFRIASIDKLRVFVPVPEIYAPLIHTGDKASLTLDEYPGQTFTGTVARNSNMIDPASRTLNVEVDVDNPKGKLLPGAYVFVHFHLPRTTQQLSVPSNTLLFRAEGLRVGLVRNGHVHLQPITISHDNGSTLEISAGLVASDDVILDPSDSLAEGEAVQILGAEGSKE